MQDDNLKMPLVSVIVITYNSEKYVSETLESIKEQTYKNIELIITDDCSTDKTVEICEEWINNNNERFSKTLIIKSDINTGTAANCNRGLKEAEGEWIKYIAGDDMLLPNCIHDNMEFVKNNKVVKFVFSDSINIYDETGITKIDKHKQIIINADAKKQYKLLLRGQLLIKTATVFMNRMTFNEISNFDENYIYVEDYPFALDVTKNGHKFYYLDEVTIKYRIHNDSTWHSIIYSSTNEVTEFKRKFYKDWILLYEKELLPGLIKHLLIVRYISAYIEYYLIKIKINAPEKYKYRKWLRYLDVVYAYRVVINKIFKSIV